MTITDEILGERTRQNLKWGSESIVSRPLEGGFRVLGEEYGEVAKAINERSRSNCREELIQVAAVAVAMIEALDAGAPLVRLPWDEHSKASA